MPRPGEPSDAGFTLIELLIVIVILGILAAIVVFAVGGISDKGTKAACRADRETVQDAAEAYYAQSANYASDITALVTANLLREAPVAGKYTILYDPLTGQVTADHNECNDL